MKLFPSFSLLLLLPAALFASEANTLLETRIARAWAPRVVRVEWEFNMPAPQALADTTGWPLAEPRPSRMAGSMVLTLTRRNAQGRIEKTTVSGNARIYGTSLILNRNIMAGAAVALTDLRPAETEWTHLTGDVVDSGDLSDSPVAAHMLVAGRALTINELKAATRIHRGQIVDLNYTDASIRIKLAGRAMQNGAVGDTIDVAVDLGRSRRFKGAVDENGLVQLIR
jgi:flagella basal body P-ring formation protein FlgA